MTMMLLFADDCLVTNCVSLNGKENFSKIDEFSDNLTMEWTYRQRILCSHLKWIKVNNDKFNFLDYELRAGFKGNITPTTIIKVHNDHMRSPEVNKSLTFSKVHA